MKSRKAIITAIRVIALIALIAACFSPTALAQTTISTGSIQGTVTDPSGAVVSGAKVTITNQGTGQAVKTATTSSGLYTSGALIPGDYVVRAEAAGFKSAELPLVVQVGVTAGGSIRLVVGQGTETVEVKGSTVAVNTEQATVQGVLTSQQIENLPINGRNFLDLAQLEPGVQIQEGSTFDPTKNGFSSISFGGRFGRTARIEVDGVDISDETVGTTTQNIPASAIEEFQISQSSLDLSTELTSSGAVNVTTRSGTNQIHGEAFGVFRGNQIAARLPGNVPPTFQREQFGGRVGGYLIKDKLFWFIAAERAKQDLTAAQPFTAPFDTLNTSLVEPFREIQTDGRLDWQIRGSAHMFYRFNFDQNSQIRPFGSSSSLQGFKNFNHTPSHTVGLDFNSGSFTHSIRFSLLEFRNSIVDGTSVIPAGINNPIPGLGINIGASVVGSCVISGGGSYCGGPNLLAPQATPQSNHQVKYDGSKVVRNHVVRYGVAFNHIQGGGFAGFFAFPQVGTVAAGSSNDPTSYPIQFAFLGNGIGFSTNEAAFGYKGGGLGPDNRFQAYLGDGWRIKPNFMLNYGLHYVRDTGRVDSNLGPLPALNMWGPGLGNRVRTPGMNFAPQVGFAWDVSRTGTTVVRGGGGLFFENTIWNNVYFDSPARSPLGTFAATPLVCVGGPNVGPGFQWPTDPGPLNTPIAGGAGVSNGDGTVSATFCNQSIAAGGSSVIALSNAFKAAAAANPPTPQPNSNFVGTALNAANLNGFDIFDPNYRTPRSWQMNIGFEHQFRPGLVFSVDYLRNIGERFLIVVDKNHSGAARSFNLGNAITARDSAQTSAGTLSAGGFTPCSTGAGQATCIINANATLVNNNGTLTPTCVGGGAPPCAATLGVSGAQAAYSAAGLDSNASTTGGAPCSFCAFPGTNPVSGNTGTVGTLDMLSPVGRSVYSGLQMKLVQRLANPVRGVRAADFQVSYAMSRFVSQVQDQDFVTIATNNDNPTQFTGPNGLDRKHQVSFGGTFDLPFFTRLSLIGHFYSALPQNLLLPQLTSGGEIFASDWLGSGLGSGTAGEPVPGTQLGQFERGTNAGNLQSLINNYNGRYAGTLTPAGAQVVNGGVMSNTDMLLLGWVMPQLASVPQGARDFGWLKSFDIRAAWPIKVKERFTVEPAVSIFNLFNFSNAFLGGNLPLAQLTPGSNGLLASNAVGGVTQQNILPFRATFQSGTYAMGAPRQLEFGLKIGF